MNITEDRLVDARDLRCPMPVVAVTKAMRRPEPGQVLTVLGTGRGALGGVPALAEDNDDELPASGEGRRVRHFHVRKSGDE